MPRHQHRTMIVLTTQRYEQLRRLAFEQRTSIAELIRQAIEEKYGPFEEAPDTQKAA